MNALLRIVLDVFAGAPEAAWRMGGVTSRITLLLLAAAVGALLLKRSSAGLRHLAWSLAIGAVLVLPALSLTVPRVEVPVLPPEAPVARAVTGVQAPIVLAGNFSPLTVRAAAEPAPAPSALDVITAHPWLAVSVWLLAMWALGVLLVLAKLGWDHAQMFGIVTRSQRVADQRLEQLQVLAKRLGLTAPPHLYESDEVPLPMIWGAWDPVVLLPSTSREWTKERLELVLLHELAHVRRFDSLTQLMAQLACALYWFHPMVWFAARRMRYLREYACDDVVLGGGAKASSYAEELVALARALERERFSSAALGMAAQRSQLYERVCAILDSERVRRNVRSRRAGLIAATVGVMLPLALLCPSASAAPEVRAEPMVMVTQVVAPAPRVHHVADEAAPHGGSCPQQRQQVSVETPSALVKQISEAKDVSALVTIAEDTNLSDEAARQAFVARTRKLPQQSDRAKALRALLFGAPISEQTGLAVLGAAKEMCEDAPRLEVLGAFHRIRESDLVRGPLVNEYLDVASQLPSDDLARALTGLLHPREVPRAAVLRALALSRRVTLPSRRLEVLQEVTDHQQLDAAVAEAFRTAVADLPGPAQKEPLSNLGEAEEDAPKEIAVINVAPEIDFSALRVKLQAKERKFREAAERFQAAEKEEQADAMEHAADQLEKELDRLEAAEEQAREQAEAAREAAEEARETAAEAN